MQRSWPYDTGNTAVLEREWALMAREWLASGVIPNRLNRLAVSADGTTMSVTVASGYAWVEGFFYENDAALALAIAAANALSPRIDRVVVRLDRAANTTTLAVLTGAPALSPTPPALTQTDALYELLLADVTVPATAGVIRAQDVVDRRTFTTRLAQTIVRRNNVALAVPNATVTAVTYPEEIRDTADMFGPATPDRLTASTAGLYQIAGWVGWAPNDTGLRALVLIVNGVAATVDQRPAVAEADATVSALVRLDVGGSLRLEVRQHSGASLDLRFARLTAARVG